MIWRLGISLFLFMLLALPVRAAEWSRGEELFRTVCAACHSLNPGSHRTGPSLHKVWMRPIGVEPGFRYSSAFQERSKTGEVWSAEALDTFLKRPRRFIKRTMMSFKGFKNPADRAAVIEFLRESTKK